MIITIERECGSAAHEVAEELAKIYHLPLFDKESMIKKAKELEIYEEVEGFFEERPMKSLFPVSDTGEMPEFGKPIYEKLRKLTSENDFIMIGRCGNYIFRNYPDVVSVFLHAEAKDRISKTMMKQGLDRWSAGKLIDEVDDKRRRFYKYYTGRNWDQASDYDLCINTSHTGINGAASMIQSYIETKFSEDKDNGSFQTLEDLDSYLGDPVSEDLFRFQ